MCKDQTEIAISPRFYRFKFFFSEKRLQSVSNRIVVGCPEHFNTEIALREKNIILIPEPLHIFLVVS